MRKFLIYFAVFVAVVVAVDIVFGLVVSRLNVSAKGGDTYNQAHITLEMTEPILIMGSSRAVHHYDPAILEDSLGMGVYNCGLDGNGILFQYGRLKLLLERYKPEVIIYDAIASFDMQDDDNSKYLAWLKRWYGHESIDSLVYDINPHERVKLRSNLYRYNKDFIQMLSDNVAPRQKITYKGFKPIDGTIDYEPEPKSEAPAEWQELKFKYFNKFIDLCERNGIKLIVVYSPWYKAATSHITDNLTTLCRQRGIEVLDYYCDPQFNSRPEYFDDASHLNSTGATVFSKEIAGRLSHYIDARR